MNYQKTLEFLYSQLPMFSRVGPSAYKKDLTNTRILCDYFGNPQSRFPSIHIGGTNGKGSTTNYLASALVESEKKVGIYTSPHLVDFRERIKIGSDMISREFVVEFVEKARPIIEEIQPSFFELTVVMAFEYFAKQNVDIALIEVGLGGRLDSTNVIQPILSIITNVSYDHMNMLGNTIQSIANEKAGIIKQKTPIIIGESNPEYDSIFKDKSIELEASIFWADQEVILEKKSIQTKFRTNKESIHLDNQFLIPPYQIKNIKTSFFAFYQYCRYANEAYNSDVFVRGIENRTRNTGFLGRWTQIYFRDRKFILESAHNEAGIVELKSTLESTQIDKPLIIFGCVKDKDVSHIISLLPQDADYILTQADIPRAMTVYDLKEIFETQKLSVLTVCEKVSDAIQIAIHEGDEGSVILVTGSIFLVGEVLGIIKKTED